ncbi:hypothetical protein IKG28_01925 [Candidatus Saccharibacteria bacterium]|nr:hypothetical protein [Candidatus Saccharibacteria bacterium]
MDGQTYLSQISGDVRPEKKSASNIFKSKFFIVGAIGVGGLLLLMLLGLILGGGGKSLEDQAVTLKLRLDNTAEMVSEYQPSIKSSDLRSVSASFNGIITNTGKELTDYLAEAYNFKDNAKKSIQEDEDLHKDGLNEELFKAKITGVLDRIYAHKMAYEISLIVNMENKLASSTKSETLKNLLETSDKSLRVIYDKFDNFSEAN